MCAHSKPDMWRKVSFKLMVFGYDETFSPVAKIKSIRMLLTIAAFHDYEIWQMDVKTAFRNGKI